MDHFIANKKTIRMIDASFAILPSIKSTIIVYSYPGERVVSRIYYYFGKIHECINELLLEDELQKTYRNKLREEILIYQQVFEKKHVELVQGLQSELCKSVDRWENCHPSHRIDYRDEPISLIFFDDDTLFSRDYLELCHVGILLTNHKENFTFYDHLRNRLHVADEDFKQFVITMIEKGKIQPIDFASTSRWWELIEEK